MNAFVDTNVPIAYSFLIDPFNKKSTIFLKKYNYIYWSALVKAEFKKVFRNKSKLLSKFYEKLLFDLESGFIFNEFTLKELKRYVKKKNYPKKRYEKIMSSLDSFWYKYVNNEYPSQKELMASINECLNDLKHVGHIRKKILESKIKLSKPRTSSYDKLKEKLECFGVHDPDYDIILDAHDWNEKTDFDLDFVTFDDTCYDGASKIDGFNFHDVKSRYDFNFG